MVEKAVETEIDPRPIARSRVYFLWCHTQPSELCLNCVSDWHLNLMLEHSTLNHHLDTSC